MKLQEQARHLQQVPSSNANLLSDNIPNPILQGFYLLQVDADCWAAWLLRIRDSTRIICKVSRHVRLGFREGKQADQWLAARVRPRKAFQYTLLHQVRDSRNTHIMQSHYQNLTRIRSTYVRGPEAPPHTFQNLLPAPQRITSQMRIK